MTATTRNEATDPMLTVDVQRWDAGVVLRLVGEIDAASATVLESAIERAADGGAAVIDLDLGRVEFMDSTGLSTIIAARSALGEDAVRVIAASAPVRRTLELTGLGALLVDG